MKLKNKKTGEVVESFKNGPIDLYFYPNEHKGGDDIERETYQSLSDLNSEWEDYAPTEPLIKDEKIRKAIRAWAEANEITQVSHDACWNAFRCSDFAIAFDYDFDRHDGFEDMKSYTIDELCGEEEE